MAKLTNQEIVRLFISGSTQAEISDLAFVSRQRVQQILKSEGVGRSQGGAWLRETGNERRARLVDERCRRIWGISHEERVQIKADHGHAPFRFFTEHRTNSKKRGIPFKFTFPQWWGMWEESGHWPDRRGGGYVMSRLGDVGAYEPGNVRIITQGANMRDWLDRRRALRTAANP